MPIPGKDSYEVQWQAQELRRDMKTDVTDWLQGPGTIAHAQGVTVGWSVQVGVSYDLFDSVKASLQLTYSRSYTETNTYTSQISAGQTARLIYVPNMHHFNGWITTWEYYDDICGSSSQGPLYCQKERNQLDHVWCPLYFPIPGGQYELESR